MTFATPLVRFRKTASLVLATTVATPLLLLAGCGIGVLNHAAATTDAAKGGMSGQIFGGPNPIIGATVKLYTTGDSSGASTGYGVATMRQEANAVSNGGSYPDGDTDVNGGFQFAGGYSCPAGQFAYVVSAGGNTGATTTTSQATAVVSPGTSYVSSISKTASGSLYTATPVVTITPGAGDTTGSGATATATLSSGTVSFFTITNRGSNYTAVPTVTVTRGAGDTTGTGATGTANIGSTGSIGGIGPVTINVTNGGAGYLSATATVVNDPSDTTGSGATVSVSISNGAVSSLNITNPGTGYTATPTIVISSASVVNPANTNAVLVAALGRCEDLFTGNIYTGTPIYINELTTVAAAYALGHFSTVSGTGASTVVNIGAPASNNAAQIGGVSTGCVAGVGACTTTATAGLAHAFQNAGTIANVFPTAGGANVATTANSTVVPAYSTYLGGASYTGAVPLVPTPVINSIANTLVACVNSAGGVANDGSACGTIFKLTTLPSGVAGFYTYSTGTSAPTNTFSAMVNLAANPSLSSSASNVAQFYNLAGTFTSVFTPTLTGPPAQDYTIAVNYPESVAAGVGTGLGTTASTCSGTCQGLGYTTTGALDINDVFYVANNSSASGTVPVNVYGFGSNGRLLGLTANSSGANGLKYATGLSVDATGFGYFGTGSASASNNFGVFTAGGGAVSALTTKTLGTGLKVYATAVDLANNVWGAGDTVNMYKAPAGVAGTGQVINSTTGYALPVALVPSSTTKNAGLQFDPNQNLWYTAGPNTATNLYVLQNTGSVAVPTYATSGGTIAATTGVGPNSGITFAGSPYVGYVGGYTTNPGEQGYTPAFGNIATPVAITSLAAGTISTAGSQTGADLIQADGTGVIYATNLSNGSLATSFGPGSSATGYKLNPCVTTTLAASTCANVFSSSANTFPKPQFVAIDSTGSIWVGGAVPTTATAGGLVEIIGTAAPTVPLISLGKQGQLP